MGDENENKNLLEALDAISAEDEGLAADLASLTEENLEPGLVGADLGQEPSAAELADLLDLSDTGSNSLAFESPTDAALDLDALLSAEVLSEPLAPVPEALGVGEAPTFQLRLEFTPELRAGLKTLGEQLGVSLPEGDSPLLTQLSEYQAVAFRQGALKLGARVRAALHFPAAAVPEEDGALGDLSEIAENRPPETEGAPSVELPKNEKAVLVLQEPGMGVNLKESLGLITAHRSIARRFFREEEAQEKLRSEVKRIPGQEFAPGLPGSRLELLFRDILLDLQKMALQKGGNAVLGLRLESFPETSHLDPALEQMRLVAFGTAAVVEKA